MSERADPTLSTNRMLMIPFGGRDLWQLPDSSPSTVLPQLPTRSAVLGRSCSTKLLLPALSVLVTGIFGALTT